MLRHLEKCIPDKKTELNALKPQISSFRETENKHIRDGNQCEKKQARHAPGTGQALPHLPDRIHCGRTHEGRKNRGIGVVHAVYKQKEQEEAGVKEPSVPCSQKAVGETKGQARHLMNAEIGRAARQPEPPVHVQGTQPPVVNVGEPD